MNETVIFNETRLECLSVTIVDDSILEGPEHLQVQLSNAHPQLNITAPDEASVLILDNDGKLLLP